MNVLKHAAPARNPAKKWRRSEAPKRIVAEGQARHFIVSHVLDAKGNVYHLGLPFQIDQLLASQRHAHEG
jgi:alpha-D-ribose 1-methylphosphonate 5-triphosphate synthase subunit PhnI